MARDDRSEPLKSGNLLLGLLNNGAKAVLWPALESVPLIFGDVLFGAYDAQRYIYFPTSGIISTIYVLDSGKTAEVGLVGRDGLSGYGALLRGGRGTTQALVQATGHAFRVRSHVVDDLIDTNAQFRTLMLRYTQVLLSQYVQTAVCVRHHTMTQQVCRWILMSLDRSRANRIQMTQELMAQMLGMRREGVSAAASELKEKGIISYSRGTIDILDRAGLEELVCECYSILAAEVNRLVPGSSPQPVIRNFIQ